MKVVTGRGKRYTDEELKIINSGEFIFNCVRCKADKPNKEYYVLNRGSVRGRRFTGYCKKCRNHEKGRSKNHSESRRKYMIKRDFNLDYSDYLDIHKIQNSCCAICGIAEKNLVGKAKRLAVDHCHSTDKVRGLLCQKCNVGIGNLQDNSELLRKAADYIEFHKARHERIIMEEKQEQVVAVPAEELVSTP